MREKCEKHGVTDCLMCSRLQSLQSDPSKPFPAPPASAAPPEITGAPPMDIEMMNKEALKAELLAATVPAGLQEEFTDAYNKAIFNPDPPSIIAPRIPATTEFGKDSFDTLPVDDSHASKVMRAAAEYASATRDWAQELARVEKIKASLQEATTALHAALARKVASEYDLKTLVDGSTPPENSHTYHYEDGPDGAVA